MFNRMNQKIRAHATATAWLWSVAGVLLAVIIVLGVTQRGSEIETVAAALSTSASTGCEMDVVTTAPPERGGIKAATSSVATAATYRYQNIPVTQFRVENLSPKAVSELDYVEWYFSRYEDCHYIFLPATADRTQLRIVWQASGTLYLNDVAVKSGELTDLLSTADTFSVRVDHTDCGQLHIMQSDLPCVFLELEELSLLKLNSNRNNEDSAQMLALYADGTVDYDGPLEKITGHGNSSWDYSMKDNKYEPDVDITYMEAKRSYNMKFDQKTNLFGLGKAKKWVLMGNYLDFSMLRNSTVFRMSELVGIDYTMEYAYIDLFIDGSYRGTYQICERVQVQKQRVNITDLEEENEKVNTEALEHYQHVYSDHNASSVALNSYKYYDLPNQPDDITGGYLIQFQLPNRYPSKSESGFVTSRGQPVQLETPEHASEAEILYIRNFVQDLEDAIYSEDGYNAKGKHYSEYIDVESIIKGYLIQEITCNADGAYTSFYFWKESDALGDGKLHYGPVWDFDLAFSNFTRTMPDYHPSKGKFFSGRTNGLFVCHMPNSAYALYRETAPECELGWLGKLYEKEDYRKQVATIYFECFDDVVSQLTEEFIPQMGEYLSTSAEMNDAMYRMLLSRKRLGPSNGKSYDEFVQYVSNFLTKHTDYLRTEWLPIAKQAIADSLPDALDLLPLTRYDAEGLAALQQKIAIGQTAITAADSYEGAKLAYAAAVASLMSIPMAEISGDFDDNGIVNYDDAVAVLVHYVRVLAEIEDPITATQERNGDVDHNGKLDAVDAMHILMHCVHQMMGDDYPLPVPAGSTPRPTIT